MWIRYQGDGYSRDQLLALRESIRIQRNVHRSSIWEYSRFFVAFLSVVFTAEAALAVYAARSLEDTHAQPGTVIAALIVILVVLCGVLIGTWTLRGYAHRLLRKEYRKLLEHLTVEQKIEAALGLDAKLPVSDKPEGTLPYPKDEAVLFPRWIKGRYDKKRSEAFVDATTDNRDVFFAPLSYCINWLFWMIIGLTGALVVVSLITLGAVFSGQSPA